MSQELGYAKTILIIEKDEQASRFLQFLLSREKFRVLATADVRRALPIIRAESPDLIVLDLTLRQPSGPMSCKELRDWSAAPILAMSDQAEERLIVAVLDAGADGFVSLPFRPGELLARIRAMLRWSPSRPGHDVITSGDLEIDLAQRLVFVAGNPVRLTRTEFNILAFLARNHDRPVSAEAILETVWGPVRGDYTQSLRVHIGHIRRKIELDPSRPRYLVTLRGGCYRLSGLGKGSGTDSEKDRSRSTGA